MHNDSERFAAYEMFLNPFDEVAMNLLTILGKQSHVKVLLHDSDIDEVRGFYEFGNNLGLDELTEVANQIISQGQKPGHFIRAQEEFMSRYSLEDMLDLW